MKRDELSGRVHIAGSYTLCQATGSVTTIAAGTASAGHLFVMRWGAAAPAVALIRSVSASFLLTTAFGAAQEVGCELFTTRTYSASHSGGTAIDLATNTNTNKLKTTGMATSAFTDVRISAAAALTNGTHTIDANAMGRVNIWAAAVGNQITPTALYDAREDQQTIMLANNEGLIVRNTILMGATGVGTWTFWVEWDEAKLI
jgi:hypothetical protein